MKYGPVVKKMLFKDISYLYLQQLLCSADRNHLCNFGIISKYGPVGLEKMSFKGFFIWSYGSPFVQLSVIICVIFVEGIMRNNSVKLF